MGGIVDRYGAVYTLFAKNGIADCSGIVSLGNTISPAFVYLDL